MIRWNLLHNFEICDSIVYAHEIYEMLLPKNESKYPLAAEIHTGSMPGMILH